MKFLNLWNQARYTMALPVYDKIAGIFSSQRKKSIDKLNIHADENILILGAGTGLDLPFLPLCGSITAIDITPGMIHRLKKRAQKSGIVVNAMIMDGQKLSFPENTFDCVILHLIVAVIPDPVKCLQEAERVLKAGGRVAVFDKFIQEGKKPSILRKIINIFSGILFSEINRSIHKLLKSTSFIIQYDENAGFHGLLRILILRKPI